MAQLMGNLQSGYQVPLPGFSRGYPHLPGQVSEMLLAAGDTTDNWTITAGQGLVAHMGVFMAVAVEVKAGYPKLAQGLVRLVAPGFVGHVTRNQ